MSLRRDWLVAAAAAAFSSACSTASSRRLPGIVDVLGARRSDWDSAPPASQGLDAAALDSALKAGTELPALRSLLVVRYGVLVAERYFGGASAADVLPVNSITKSVSSMLVGQALQRGTLPGLSAPLSRLLPEALAQVPGSAASDITLDQILTGRTGLAYDWVKDGRALGNASSPVHYALSLPAAQQPAWNYNDAAVGLVAPILARADGMDLAALAARVLFAPLGVERFSWGRDRSGQSTAYGGLALRARDVMKLAWTMLDGGRWQGAQVLPSAWTTDSIRSRGPASWRFANVADVGYGCLWFTGTMQGHAVAWGLGYGGQVMMLVPGLKLAVAVAATSPRIEEVASQNIAIFGLVSRVVRAAA